MCSQTYEEFLARRPLCISPHRDQIEHYSAGVGDSPGWPRTTGFISCTTSTCPHTAICTEYVRKYLVRLENRLSRKVGKAMSQTRGAPDVDMPTASGLHRVLLVAARYFPYMGGMETHVYEVGQRLARAGISVTI